MISISGLDVTELEKLAMDPSSSPELLLELSVHESDSVRGFVAGNAFASPELIGALADDPALGVAKSAALNPGLPEAAALGLTSNRFLIVRMALAQNLGLGLNVLNVLLEDSEPIVRELAAGNPRLPLNRIYELMVSEDADVRAGVCSNPSSDLNVWAALFKDSSYRVASVAEYYLTSLSDTDFREALRSAGREDWAGLPREWVMKALGQ